LPAIISALRARRSASSSSSGTSTGDR
jgi:hypothetical protein